MLSLFQAVFLKINPQTSLNVNDQMDTGLKTMYPVFIIFQTVEAVRVL